MVAPAVPIPLRWYTAAMPADRKDDALEEALDRAVRIIEDAEACGSEPVIDALEKNAPEPDSMPDE